MAVCAKEMNKPFYVVAESFKFTRIYPLNQHDVPNEFKVGYNKYWPRKTYPTKFIYLNAAIHNFK